MPYRRRSSAGTTVCPRLVTVDFITYHPQVPIVQVFLRKCKIFWPDVLHIEANTFLVSLLWRQTMSTLCRWCGSGEGELLLMVWCSTSSPLLTERACTNASVTSHRRNCRPWSRQSPSTAVHRLHYPARCRHLCLIHPRQGPCRSPHRSLCSREER